MQISSAQLVVRAQADDTHAFALLVQQHREEIVRLVLRFARGADDAQDLAQETFVAAFQHLPALREPEKFVPWLQRIALNAARQWWRHESQLSLESLWDGSDPGGSARAIHADQAEQRLRAFVQDALATLPPEPRSALLLHYFDGYDYGETAALLDVPVSTVRGRLHLARRQLRKEMAELAPPKTTPKPPPASEEFTLTAEDLSALRGAELLSSDDPERPVIQTVCVEPDGTLVSTDTHRLYVFRNSSIRPKERALVRRTLLSGLKHRHGLREATLSFTQTEVTLRIVDQRDTPPERVFRASLVLEGRFPNYDRVIPKDWKFTALLSIRDLLSALDEVARFDAFLTSTAMPDGGHEGRRVTLTLSPRTGGVLVQDGAVRLEPVPARWSMHVEILAILTGLLATEELTIALNRTYLRESLQALNIAPDERVQMRFNGPVLPIQIQPEAADDRFIVLMPMHLYL